MKLFLVNPRLMDERINEYDTSAVPIGLYYLAAAAEDSGHHVTLVNLAAEKEPDRYFKQLLEKEKPDMVGFTVLNANRSGAVEGARLAKQIVPETTNVFGGPSATFLGEFFIRNVPELDFVVSGEGEITLMELARAVESGANEGYDLIPGLVCRKDGQPFRTAERGRVENIDDLSEPSRFHTFQHLAFSRGCPGNCRFCGSPAFWGKGHVRFHSPLRIADQVERLYRKGVTHFYFSDDTFTMKKERVIELCRTLVQKKIPVTFNAISRADFIDEEMLFHMRKAGCIQISFGVESGSDRIRNALGKPIKKDRIIRAFDLAAAHGILPRAYFIYGSPGETDQTIEESCDLMLRIRPLGAIFHVLTVFPGTYFYSLLKKENRVTDQVWEQNVEDIPWFEVDPDLDFEKVKRFGERLRHTFFDHLDKFALQVTLVRRSDLYSEHADFLARLAMTFAFGEYARIPQVQNKQSTARILFERSLTYADDAKAYLGLGMLHMRDGEFGKAVEAAGRGMEIFPGDNDLGVCMGVSCMNMGRFDRALFYFQKCKGSPEVDNYIRICREKLNG
ncbi:MAG: radical SAM protein [Desulfobacteraceae bacterium]